MKTLLHKSTLSLLIAIVISTTFSSCKKYDEGPMISFRSKAERVANTWRVENFLMNNVDVTALSIGYVETFTKDGNYSFSNGKYEGTGKWAFQNDDKEIKVSGVANASSKTLVILRLNEKHFWYYYMEGNDKAEFHLIPN